MLNEGAGKVDRLKSATHPYPPPGGGCPEGAGEERRYVGNTVQMGEKKLVVIYRP